MKNEYVMVIEDDRDIRENLKELLESEGYSVVVAENGKVALELLLRETNYPYVILLDLMMPIMDGREFIKAIHEIPSLKELPIVVISAGFEKIEGRIAGFMKKPLDLEEVLLVVEKFANEREGRRRDV